MASPLGAAVGMAQCRYCWLRWDGQSRAPLPASAVAACILAGSGLCCAAGSRAVPVPSSPGAAARAGKLMHGPEHSPVWGVQGVRLGGHLPGRRAAVKAASSLETSDNLPNACSIGNNPMPGLPPPFT